VPNIRTAPAIRKRIIEFLKSDYESKGRPRVYKIIDMGSGNGLLTREIARALPGAQIVGLEIATMAFRWSVIFARIQGFKNLSYHQCDFTAYDISNADAITVFLTIYNMGAMGQKLKAEMKPGAIATSNKFKLDGWEPLESLSIRTLYPHQKNLYFYRK
jgi:hypothetical protein